MGGLCGKGKKDVVDTGKEKPEEKEVEQTSPVEKKRPTTATKRSKGKSEGSKLKPKEPSKVKEPLKRMKRKETGKGAKGKGAKEKEPLPDGSAPPEEVPKAPPREPYGENQQKVWIGLPTTRRRRRGQWRVKKTTDYNSNSNNPSIYIPTKSYCARNYYAYAQQCADFNLEDLATSWSCPNQVMSYL